MKRCIGWLSCIIICFGLPGCTSGAPQSSDPSPTSSATELPQVQSARDRINTAVQQDADSLKKMDQTENTLQNGNTQ